MSFGFDARDKARADFNPLTIDAFRVMDQTPAHATARLFLIPRPDACWKCVCSPTCFRC